jgi:hypothetical protein
VKLVPIQTELRILQLIREAPDKSIPDKFIMDRSAPIR